VLAWRIIQGMQKVEAYGGKFALAGLQETVRSIFEISRLDQVFQIFQMWTRRWSQPESEFPRSAQHFLRYRTALRTVCLSVSLQARHTASDHNWIASRKPTRSFAKSTIDPCTPSSIISLNPFARVVITGKPQASPSKQALENGS